MSGTGQAGSALHHAVRRLAQLAAIADVVDLLRESGVPAMLLKGEATYDALYCPDEVRPTADIDLLVPADLRAQADAALVSAGWRQRLPDLHSGEAAAHSVDWWQRRGDLRIALDLHTSFHGVQAPPQTVWDTWWPRSEPLSIGGRTVPGPSHATTALVVALHRNRTLPGSSAAEDLRRAVATFPVHVWEDAARQADLLGCGGAVRAGLVNTPAGDALCRALGLEAAPWHEELGQRDRDPLALHLAHLGRLPGFRARARRLARAALPSRTWLDQRHPYAARGGPWLALARLHRVADLAARSPRAASSLLTARCRARGSAG